MLKLASTVVERLLHRRKVEGLSPVANAGSGRKKMAKIYFYYF